MPKEPEKLSDNALLRRTPARSRDDENRQSDGFWQSRVCKHPIRLGILTMLPQMLVFQRLDILCRGSLICDKRR